MDGDSLELESGALLAMGMLVLEESILSCGRCWLSVGRSGLCSQVVVLDLIS